MTHKTPLHYASKFGNLENVKLLLNHKDILINPQVISKLFILMLTFKNFLNRMPIHEASEFGHVEVMKYLLSDPRIDVNAVDISNN